MRMSEAIVLLAAALAYPAAAQEKVFVQVPAVMDPGAKVDSDVRVQCELTAMVGRQVLQQASERKLNAVVLDPATAGSRRFIRVRIVGAAAMVGVGMRQIDVYAEVVQDDQVVDSRRIRERTSVTPGIGMPLCDVMDHIAEK